MQLIEILRDYVLSLEAGSGLQSRVPQFDSGFRLQFYQADFQVLQRFAGDLISQAALT